MRALRAAVPERRTESRAPYLAIIVTDGACNVKLCSFDQSAGNEIHNLLCAGGKRLRPELETVVSKLIEECPDGSAAHSRVVLFDEERTLRLSPLASPDGIQFALIVERDHTYDRIGRAVTRFKLTRRQTEVLALVLEGASAGEIAHQLTISEYTAQGYIKSLLSKTDSRNRAAMVARVLEWEQPAATWERPAIPTYVVASDRER